MSRSVFCCTEPPTGVASGFEEKMIETKKWYRKVNNYRLPCPLMDCSRWSSFSCRAQSELTGVFVRAIPSSHSKHHLINVRYFFYRQPSQRYTLLYLSSMEHTWKKHRYENVWVSLPLPMHLHLHIYWTMSGNTWCSFPVYVFTLLPFLLLCRINHEYRRPNWLNFLEIYLSLVNFNTIRYLTLNISGYGKERKEQRIFLVLKLTNYCVKTSDESNEMRQ